ncbi:PREDICTED: mannosyl-oligosaccharide glucosidase GCS1-like [Erythranthe guttata]|uniref:mannosyl-oligosaccharide glucosidase GCS1-like n=1 Tax=Erythranthe guttata TaxID=4155 RepID=UPI00064DCBC0|nr:PREDICTED: mannosyl-oligosaccharide glucosidase GCS1-like [Erythranthe guttata]|eukprot:XP_012851159.1 PREDICTED: mannosyl-oligosaccharide glucosidase GCS1-like [Erythranthe guttata]
MTRPSRRNTRGKTESSSDGDQPPINQNPNPKTRMPARRNRKFSRILSLSLCGLLLVAIGLFFNKYYINPMKKTVKPRVVTPLPAPKLMDLPMFQGEHKESLYWGTYRPHVYFGIRARTPQSLVAGLMWIGVTDGRYSMRHVCQDSDGLKKYGWTHHNARDYGRQVFVDQRLTLTTSFLKSKEIESGYGGDWAVRLEADTEEVNKEKTEIVHLFFYMADEGGTALGLGRGISDITDDHTLAFGSRDDLGSWQLHLESKDVFEFHYAGFKTQHIHNLSDLVQTNLGIQARNLGRLQLSDTADYAPNILVFQISAKLPFKADIAFISKSSDSTSRTVERVKVLTGDSLTSLLEQKQKQFDDKYQRCFNMPDELNAEAITVGKATLGNLLGGIGYFYGQSKISLPSSSNLVSGDNYISYWPAELYTAVPSRPFFPRGFLWDEGFHQLLIWRWDVKISLDIIGHWLDLMNADGWIPREQILGAEALSKVPSEFVLQYPTNGNPPTLFLVLRDLVSGIKKNKFTASETNEITIFLRRAFVRLDAWLKWFNTTQSGKDVGTYFWHGRDNVTTRELNPKSLSSGLDDYPRASHPSEDERHVDLRCWMHLAADCMSSISELLEDRHVGKEYGLTAKLLSDFELLNHMHFDYESGAYFDYGYHTEKVRLSWRVVEAAGSYPTREFVREVLQKPTLRLVPHIGYVSLFPFMDRLIPPESWILEKQLDLISNTSTLWTKYGLRSLARTSSIYMQRNTEHDPPYWRGPVWMNMNYMILSALHYYSEVDGPYRDRAKIIYNDLRNNLIRNVVRNYNETGFIWEQYDQKKGRGKGARVFTGWTSLIVLIMSEVYSDS